MSKSSDTVYAVARLYRIEPERFVAWWRELEPAATLDSSFTDADFDRLCKHLEHAKRGSPDRAENIERERAWRDLTHLPPPPELARPDGPYLDCGTPLLHDRLRWFTLLDRYWAYARRRGGDDSLGRSPPEAREDANATIAAVRTHLEAAMALIDR